MEIDVPYLTEVYWIGKTIQFGDLICKNIDEEDFEDVTKLKHSPICPVQKIILLWERK